MRPLDKTRTAAEVLVDQLMINGVGHVFCVPGESYLAVLDAFHDRKLAVTVCRQEGGAAMMAEAVGKATGAPGKNWLFFGHQRSGSDYFYADELNAMKASGLLTRLSLAWSRDGDKKFYVQDRMREVGREVWTWLAEGANIYICGDAKRMAKDVERALVDIVAQFGARSTDEAVLFVANLKKKGRFQQDVY